MPQFSRTWWGQKFIESLETFTESNRLSRGRSYARGGKVVSFQIKRNLVTAQVRGSINPYFGVHKEPLYNTTIEFTAISPAQWTAIITAIAAKASLISRLLLNEIPESIEVSFKALGLNFLPHSRDDFHTNCSCPDWSNPCKHIAGVHYLLAAELDRDPFLLFELRGISREELKTELAKSPLGQVLSGELDAKPKALPTVTSYYTKLKTTPATPVSLKEFWQGEKHLPPAIAVVEPSPVSAILVKKEGDFPPFWQRDNSFIAAMEELYQRVRTKNKEVL